MKILLNAAEVIKDMSRKELKEYKITLEKEGKKPNPPSWFEPYAKILDKLQDFVLQQQKFNQDQQKFNSQVSNFMADQQKFNKLIMKRLDNLVSKNNLKE